MPADPLAAALLTLREHKITQLAYLMLSRLADGEDHRPADLYRQLDVTHTAVCTTANSLADRGLITKTRPDDGTDRRAVRYRITPAGLRLHRSITKPS